MLLVGKHSHPGFPALREYCWLLIASLLLCTGVLSAEPMWTWIDGPDEIAGPRASGTLGVPHPANNPSRRTSASTWTDLSGNLWLFAGRGWDDMMHQYLPFSDLWKYDISSGNWTCIRGNSATPVYGTRGVAAAANSPGFRENAVTWTDASNRLWLFGGDGQSSTGSGKLNDLWKYDQASGYWTWMNGSNLRNQYGVYGVQGTAAPGNTPGSRSSAGGWVDTAGNLWLFGGSGYGASAPGTLNDLWMYDIQSGNWVWVNGSDGVNQNASHGVLGVESPDNHPGSRTVAICFSAESDTLRLFGGSGYVNSSSGSLGDLWSYNVASGNWTWLSGSSSLNASSVYGTKGVPAAENRPAARSYGAGWSDGAGHLWMFDVSTADMWRYDLATGYWTWMKGSHSTDCYGGTYGLQGTPSSDNAPGARDTVSFWPTASGKLWLFGGWFMGNMTLEFQNDLWNYDPITNNWCWMKGGDWTSITYREGPVNVASFENQPMARYQASRWLDNSGDLWMFGGNAGSNNSAQLLGDLWQGHRTDGVWVWTPRGYYSPNPVYGVQGVPAATNSPGARFRAVNWKYDSGSLWLFGGRGVYNPSTYRYNYHNDLWRYDLSSGWWTWLKGWHLPDQVGNYGTPGVPAATNVPGARDNSFAWTDGTGNLWLFGGYNENRYFGDLWKYDPASGYWTFVNGSQTHNQPGTYGTQGVPAAQNKPGGRQAGVTWTDEAGNFWLFGGQGYGATAGLGTLNDLWMFDVASGNWTWIKGSNAVNQPGVYGTLGTGDAANTPGSRQRSVGWTDAAGDLWMFGGCSEIELTALNDLWKFDMASRNWVWMGGSSSPNQPSTSGARGLVSPDNVPGAREAPVAWKDDHGTVWMFGGRGRDAAGGGHRTNNDFWMLRNYQAPDADAGGPYSILQDEALFLDATGSTEPDAVVGDSIVSYEWDLTDNGSFEASGSQPTIGWSMLQAEGIAAPYGGPVRLRVVDETGYSNTTTTQLNVYHYRVTYATDGTPDASLDGPTTQYVNVDGSCIAVTAVPPDGMKFMRWTNSGTHYSGDNPLTVVSPASSLNLVAEFAEAIAPSSSLYPLADSTRGSSSLCLTFSASDVGTGVAYTELWVKAPGATEFAYTGLSQPGISGTFDYAYAAGDGVYEFITKAVDNVANSQDLASAGDVITLVNTEENSTFSRSFLTGNGIEVFPMTDDLDVTITLIWGMPGAGITVSRVCPARASAPDYFRSPEELLDDSIQIVTHGLPPGFAAKVDWAYNPANAPAGGINTVWRFTGGAAPAQSLTASAEGNVITFVTTDFSSFYAGNAVAVPVRLSRFMLE